MRAGIQPFTSLLIALALMVTTGAVAAAAPPLAPVIVSPAPTNVSPEDVHFEVAPFRDPDGDDHAATDWEIRTADGATVLWAAYGSLALTHAHLNNGEFQGPLQNQRSLEAKTVYQVRARFRDSRGDYSPWSERTFITIRLDRAIPRQARGLLPWPAPTWLTDGGTPVGLPHGARLEVRQLGGAILLTVSAGDSGLSATVTPVEPTTAPLRLHLLASAEQPIDLPTTRLRLVTDHAERVTAYLPALRVEPGQELILWISEPGATFYDQAESRELPFWRLARDIAIPWRVESGFRAEAVGAAFQLPVSLVFVPDPGPDPAAPRYYVTELAGRIRAVSNDGRMTTYADNLLNYSPSAEFPGSGETGLIGLCQPPGSRDLFATLVHVDGEQLRLRVIRLTSSDDGRRATAITTILAARTDQGFVRPSHQVQQCSFGPDGKLYVSVADGTGPNQSNDDRTFNGKVLRLNPDGSAPADNPRYDRANPTAAISYQYTRGHRNPFGMAWRLADSSLYLSENGPNVDRLVRAEAGRHYGWDGTDESMATGALYVWPEARHSPVGLTFAEGSAAAALPAAKHGHLFVANAGPVYGEGPQRNGKTIEEFILEPDGSIVQEPTIFARNVGEGRGSILDLKLRPDGLYFTDLYLDDGEGGATAPGGKVWRIRYTGQAAFTASVITGPAPLTVAFANTATLPGSALWEFGDGSSATETDPTHTFASPGRYAVSLTVTGADGTVDEALTLITVTAADGSTPMAATTVPLPRPAVPGSLHFPETGVQLAGGFKHYWEQNGGLAAFGYPLTPEFQEINPVDGQAYTVQYFERARFEYHPEYKETPYETQLGLLGHQITSQRRAEAPFQPLAAPPDGARFFAETGHSLSGPFRDYWERSGGLERLGLPISEPFRESPQRSGPGATIQYFERVRLEYRPEWAGTARAIRLSRLGTAMLARANG